MFNNFMPPPVEDLPKPPISSVEAEKLNIGNGDNSFRADERGAWAGAHSPDDAPFGFDMKGNIKMRSTPEGGASITFYDENGTPRIFIGFE